MSSLAGILSTIKMSQRPQECFRGFKDVVKCTVIEPVRLLSISALHHVTISEQSTFPVNRPASL